MTSGASGGTDTAAELRDALAQAERRCRAPGADASDWAGLAQLRLSSGHQREALAAFDQAEQLRPGMPAVSNGAAHALILLGRAPEALARLRQQLGVTPHDVDTRVNWAIVAESLGRADDALEQYGVALSLRPGDYRARLNRAALHMAAGRLDESLADYGELIMQHPDAAAAWYSRGECLLKLRRFRDAHVSCERALALEPGHVRAMLCGAVARALDGDTEAAQAGFERAWALDPAAVARYGEAAAWSADIPDARAIRLLDLFSRFDDCDWSQYDAYVELVQRCADDAPQRRTDPSLAFFAMYSPLAPAAQVALHRAVSRTLSVTPAPAGRPRERGHIRIGYLSSRFTYTAHSILKGAVFATHDRNRFEVFAYALNTDDGSAEFARARQDADEFVELATLSDADAAARIRADGVDVLVDFNGYSNEARSEILAHRAAPLQVCWMGHMHSLMAPWVDYRFTDRVSEPEDRALGGDEGRVFLPPSFFLYDDARAPAAVTPRADAGLPEDAVVLCAFMGTKKIEPRVFGAWMAILRRCDDAVLWLLDPGERGRGNLAEAARAAGVSPARLLFAPALPHGRHLERLGAAELYLDAFVHGAHTTALDAFYSGVPMLTLKGETWCRRVGAGMLTALGQDSLIVDSADAFVERAVELARDRAALQGLRASLVASMAQDRPFATATVLPRAERAFEQMVARARDGMAPADLDVA
ncbi:MAG: O-linked N-acetylglucosamine transferase, SPINDLY family protein [Gammaproteobacteria bacterium]